MTPTWWFFKKKAEPLDLTPYQGNWVAVKNGKLVAYAPTAIELMGVLTSDKKFAGTEAWFEEYPEKVMRWSVQYASRPGYVYPNCLFSSRESAEAWVKSWDDGKHEVGTVFTRDGQHEPWRPADQS